MKVAKLLSNFFLTCSLISFVLFIYLLGQRFLPNELSFDTTGINLENANSINTKPEAIIIPSLGINLPVVPANIVENNWETTDKGVSYLIGSPLPGETGNSILYGHNWPNILGKLKKVEAGSEIFISLSDGRSIKFIVEYTQEVFPSQRGVLENTDDKRITLYTCSGFLDSKRFVVTAIYPGEKVGSSI